MKKWFEDHWLHLTIGATFAAVVAVCIIGSDCVPDNVSAPEIDLSDDSWRDILKSGAEFNGRMLTVRETADLLAVDEYVLECLYRDDPCTIELAANSIFNYITDDIPTRGYLTSIVEA